MSKLARTISAVVVERIPQHLARDAARTVLARLDMTQRIGVEPQPFARTLFLGTDPIAAMREAGAVNLASAFRRDLHAALAGLCGLCGAPITRLSEVTFDHVVPRAKGGGNYANLVPAHSGCNNDKSDRMPTACERLMLEVVNLRMGNRQAGVVWLGRQRATLADVFPMKKEAAR